jgi:hypothetical protein
MGRGRGGGMKKVYLFCSMFLWFAGSIFASDLNVGELINICTLRLGKKPPQIMMDGFRTGRNVYSMPYKAGTMSYVTTEGDIITDATIVKVFEHDHEAYNYLVLFYNFLEKDGWEFQLSPFGESNTMYETYIKDGIIAVILPPSRRIDGLIASGILLKKEDT